MGWRSPRREIWWFPILWRIAFFISRRAGGIFSPAKPRAMFSASPISIRRCAGVLAGPHLISLDSNDRTLCRRHGQQSHRRSAERAQRPATIRAVLFSIAGLNNPYGVFVDPASGAIWIANTSGNQVLQYASGVAVIENATPSATLNVFGPVSVTHGSIRQSSDRRRGRQSRGVLLSGHRLHHFGGRRAGPALGERREFLRPIRAWNAGHHFLFPLGAVRYRSLQQSTSSATCKFRWVERPRHCMFVSPSQINFQVPGATPVGRA